MAWNESFSVADAGGWAGDMSFATAPPKEAQSVKVAERLPIPVSVADLHESANAEEKYQLGDYPFSTQNKVSEWCTQPMAAVPDAARVGDTATPIANAGPTVANAGPFLTTSVTASGSRPFWSDRAVKVITIGIVKSVAELENTTNHVLGDPEDMSKDFEVLTYSGVSETEIGSSTFVEGTKVMVVGKLRSLSDRHGIMSYNIREVIDEKEYRAFVLEAKIAKIYFGKNVPSILRSGVGQSLSGCAAGPPADRNPTSGPKENLTVFGMPTTRLYNTPGETSSLTRGHNLDGQRGKIMDLLQREKDNYDSVGISEEDIKKAIGANNMDSLRKDLQFLVNEGHIYNTTDDEHYALID